MSDLLIETDSISLFHEETAVIRASSDNGLLYYKSSNNFIATVDEKGVVTANVVGIAEISVHDSKEAKVCKVTVKPQFFISIHPFINFGASIAELKNTVKDIPTILVTNAVFSPSNKFGMLLSILLVSKASSPIRIPTNVPRMPKDVISVGAYSTNFSNFLFLSE